MILFMVLAFGCLFIPGLSGGIFPSKVSAKASPNIKKKAMKAYRDFVRKSDYAWFYLIDINKDGVKELILSNRNNYTDIKIYAYSKGKIQFIENDYSMMGYSYNKKTKRLHGGWEGSGSIEDWYYTISKSGKLKRVYLDMFEEWDSNGKTRYEYYYHGKKISKKAYLKKKREWDKNRELINMHKTNNKNIKKYIR